MFFLFVCCFGFVVLELLLYLWRILFGRPRGLLLGFRRPRGLLLGFGRPRGLPLLMLFIMIYALFVAIDDYPIPNHRLNGCVNDASALLTYLENNYDCDDLNITTLFNEQATKVNIIAGFKHFKAAKDGDTCLFYYSGHGSQAAAPAEFRHLDPDGKVETIVCHDSRLPGGRDLMDKELSFLIWEANKNKDIHFSAVFDCCHSGTNTRDVRVKARMADTHKDIPGLRDFHGQAQYSFKEVAGRKEVTPPRGRHVQIAASKANETAKELRIGPQTRGAFTYNLIALLEQNNGELTYSQLISNLKIKVANYVEQQTPQIDATNPEDKNRYFLGQKPTNKPTSYVVNFDTKKNSWLVNIGQVHHLPPDKIDEIGLEIDVDGQMIAAKITQVNMMRSTIAALAALDKNKSYQAVLTKIPVQSLQLAFDPDCSEEARTSILKSAKDLPSPYYTLQKDAKTADYWIRSTDDNLQLTLPGEKRPVFRRIAGCTEDSAEIFLGDTATVSHWHYVKNIQNPRTTLNTKDYSIELYKIDNPQQWEADDNTPATLMDIDDAVVFNYDYDASKPKKERWVMPAFRLKVKNISKRTLFFSAVNLLSDYGIQNKFLPNQELAPNQEAWLMDTLDNGDSFKCIPLEVQESFIRHGVNEISEFIKIFISTREISTDDFNQASLELDDPDKSARKRAGRRAVNYPPKHDWRTVDIQLRVVRPLHELNLSSGEKAVMTDTLSIEMPEGLSCMAMLNCQTETARNLGDDAPPEPASGWAMHNLAPGMSNKPPVNVLELYESAGTDKVNVDNPIKLQLNQKLEDGEFMLPVGFDAETGLYYPLGAMDEDGTIRIENLPAPSTTGTRSLGGSIKIFFQKTISRFIPFVYTHPQLSLGGFEDAKPDEKVACGLHVTYSLDDKKTQKAVEDAQKIVLFIHGIIGDTASMPKALRLVKDGDGNTLEDQYDLFLTFDYENLKTPIEDTAADFKKKLEAIGLGAGHSKEFHIVAHSMGGLVSRWFVEKLEGNKVVNHLYMLGTPNQGSPYGSLYEMVTPLLANAVNGAVFLKPYILPIKYAGKFFDKMFHTLKQMNSDSDFLKELNDGTDPGIPYTIIAGNTKLIPPAILDKHNTLLKKLMARFKSRGHYTALDLLLFKEANDIAVTTKFIKEIPGTDGWEMPPKTIEVASDHISYFGDADSLAVMGVEML